MPMLMYRKYFAWRDVSALPPIKIPLFSCLFSETTASKSTSALSVSCVVRLLLPRMARMDVALRRTISALLSQRCRWSYRGCDDSSSPAIPPRLHGGLNNCVGNMAEKTRNPRGLDRQYRAVAVWLDNAGRDGLTKYILWIN